MDERLNPDRMTFGRQSTGAGHPGVMDSGLPTGSQLPIKKSTTSKSSKPREYDYFMKVVLVGASNVGKSSLMMRFTDDKFNETYVNTIGVDFRFRTLTILGKRVKVQVWDTAGQEKFRTMTSTFYRGSDAILMAYDITEPGSYEDLTSYWGKEIEKHCPEVPLLVLVGTKTDLEDKRKMQPFNSAHIQLKIGASQRNVRVVETSSKRSVGVLEIFEELATEFVRTKESRRIQKGSGGVQTIQGGLGDNDGQQKLSKDAVVKKDESSKCKC
jgi:small GTP-binding protein